MGFKSDDMMLMVEGNVSSNDVTHSKPVAAPQ